MRYLPCLLLLFSVCCVTAGFGVTPALAEEADRPAVLLRKALFLTPPKAAGSGLAPEVKVRVVVDEHGRVAEAEVLSVEPSTEYDEIFREATLKDLQAQRYAPAVVNGEEVEKTLEWSIQFKPAASVHVEGKVIDPWRRPNGIFGTSAEDYAALAREERIQLMKKRQDGYIRAAERHLTTETPLRIRTPRFVLVSDLQDEETVRAVANNLEVLFNVLDDLFGEAIPMQGDELTQVAFLYAQRSSYNALRSELHLSDFSGAMTLREGVLAFQAQGWVVDSLQHVVLHEATHAWSLHHLLPAGIELPLWLEEGLAEYISYSKVKRGELVFGREQRQRFIMRHGNVLKATTRAGISLQEIKTSIYQGEGLTVEELMEADREVFYSSKSWSYYPTAWLFVHFLRHGEENWATDKFPQLLFYIAEGYSSSDALAHVYGVTSEELEQPFRKYVKKF